MAAEARPAVTPAPPRASGHLPGVGAVAAVLRGPTDYFQRNRERVGDTFLVDALGYRLLCLFSPEGVKNLWALPEAQASKGLGDFALLAHKVPAELFAGRRTFPHELFGRDDVEVYLENLRRAVAAELEALGAAGELELFAFTRQLAHRMGLASWGGIDGDFAPWLPRLAACFDRLDMAESFVHPSRAIWTWATGKRQERRALAEIEALYAERLLAEPQRTGRAGEGGADLFARICERWADAPPGEREQGIARDVVLVHMGSQSNLYAAMAWTLVHLLERPALLEQVRAGDDALLERCAHETIRLRQRSIVLRRVLAPLEIADEKTAYRVAPGAFVATMMSVTNTRAAPGLDGFDPAHYEGARFTRSGELPAREWVTTFGHGRHSCPAMRFSISAIRIAVRALLEGFTLTPRFHGPGPLRRQLGGVARADRPCRVGYALGAPGAGSAA